MKFFTATGRASMPVQFPVTSRSAPNFTLIRMRSRGRPRSASRISSSLCPMP
jgi:hypothetical protein